MLPFVIGAFQRLFETPTVVGAKTGGFLRRPSQFRLSPVMLGLKVVIASARPVRLIEAGVAHLRLLRPQRGSVHHEPADGHTLPAEARLLVATIDTSAG